MAANSHRAVQKFVLRGFSEDRQLQGCCFAFFPPLLPECTCRKHPHGRGHQPESRPPHSNALLSPPSGPFRHRLHIHCPPQIAGGAGGHSQLFFLTWFLGAELLLLTTMAYDGYVAVCLGTLVSGQCGQHVSAHGLRLSFCGSDQNQNFLCEVPTLRLLSCSPTALSNIMTMIIDVYFGVVNFLLTMVSHPLHHRQPLQHPAHPHRGGQSRRPSPRAPPTCCWSACTTPPSSTPPCSWAPAPPWTTAEWWLCCTQWSAPP